MTDQFENAYMGFSACDRCVRMRVIDDNGQTWVIDLTDAQTTDALLNWLAPRTAPGNSPD